MGARQRGQLHMWPSVPRHLGGQPRDRDRNCLSVADSRLLTTAAMASGKASVTESGWHWGEPAPIVSSKHSHRAAAHEVSLSCAFVLVQRHVVAGSWGIRGSMGLGGKRLPAVQQSVLPNSTWWCGGRAAAWHLQGHAMPMPAAGCKPAGLTRCCCRGRCGRARCRALLGEKQGRRAVSSKRSHEQ